MAAALLATVLGAAVMATRTGIGATSGHELVADERELRSRLLRFEDRADGGVVVRDGRTGVSLEILAPGSANFERGALRALVRQRRLEGRDEPGAFRLTRWSNGALTLEDPETGTRLHLDAFGPANAASFARLLSATGTDDEARPANGGRPPDTAGAIAGNRTGG